MRPARNKIHCDFSCCLNRVRVQQCTLGASPGAQCADILYHAGFIIRPHHRYQCRTKTQGRIDFRVGADGTIFFLEANTAPGMTGNSLIPKAALWFVAHVLPWYKLTGQGLQITPSDNVAMLRALAARAQEFLNQLDGPIGRSVGEEDELPVRVERESRGRRHVLAARQGPAPTS